MHTMPSGNACSTRYFLRHWAYWNLPGIIAICNTGYDTVSQIFFACGIDSLLLCGIDSLLLLVWSPEYAFNQLEAMCSVDVPYRKYQCANENASRLLWAWIEDPKKRTSAEVSFLLT